MSNNNFRFSLRLKSILIVFLIAILLTVFFLFYVIPEQDKQAVASLNKAANSHLKTLSIAVVSPLLKLQYASIHELMDSQQKENPHWTRLSLVTHDGKQIYPLVNDSAAVQKNEIYTETEVVFLGRKLGVLSLVSNISAQLNEMHQQVYKNILVIIGFLFILLIGFLVYIEKTITRPLEYLSRAIKELTTKDYSYQLPKFKNDEVGSVVNGFKVMRDKLRIMVEDVEMAHQEAVKANAIKSEFLANMSHEIRTPLNVVAGITHLLKQTELNEQQYKYTNTVSRSITHVTYIVDDLLDFSRIEAGKLELNAKPFDLDQVLDDLIAFVREDAAVKEIEILYDIPFDVPRALIGDATRLTQILINLVGNAIKFSDHGEVILSASLQSYSKHHVIVDFAVNDNGIGLDDAQASKIFDAFNQADTTLTREFGGLGLGLAVSKYLVEAMEGQIKVDSIPGVGSKFQFSVKMGLQPFEKYKSFIVPADLNNLRVLIVDDSKSCCQVMAAILSEFSFQHTEVNSGKEAIELLEQNYRLNHEPGFDLILLDWLMPDMNGLETATYIHNKMNFPSRPLIITVSTNDEDDVMPQAYQAGIHGYLPKPVNASMLYDIIMREMGKNLPKAHWRKSNMDQAEVFKIDGQRKRILIVEDQQTNRQIATEILNRNNFVVETVENGKLAVDLITQNPTAFDLVLMDLQMPVMDGYEATRLIRQIVTQEQLPVIAMTAHALEHEREKCREVGMNSHLSKPMNVQKVLTEIGSCLNIEILADESVSPSLIDGLPDQIAGIDIREGVKRVMGNYNLYSRLLRDFPAQYQAVLKNIKSSIASKDYQKAAEQSHTIAGSAGNLSMKALRKSCKALQMAIETDEGSIEYLVKDVEKQMSIVVDSISELGLQSDDLSINQEHSSLQSKQENEAENSFDKSENDLSLRPLFDELLELLIANDLSAQEKLTSILLKTVDNNDIEYLQNIESLIVRLDFSQAIVVLEKFITAKGIEPGG